MQKSAILFFLLVFGLSTHLAKAQLQSPSEFLPHKWGEQFTPHHLLVDYFEHVAANSNNILLEEYGRTQEARPQLLAVVSSPANIVRIEQIRKDNLIRAGLLEGQVSSRDPIAIVWLGHSVHGNEAAGSESVLQTIYKLANPNEKEIQSWLENTVVLVDPSLNPDGYSRYTHWYRRTHNKLLNPAPEDIEHREPWPGGRTNHYFFDLNRDWAWQTQIESENRVKVYKNWLPHVHADLHEQGVNSPYYFAPAARPYHDYITDFQVDFQTEIGNNHMKYFDKEGWLYFTKEVFDLLYPSYADTYATFNGGIGMTYEQGGSGRAGRSIQMENEDHLTLMDRVMHHHTTALSTIEMSSKNADRLVKEFEKYFSSHSANPKGVYKSYIIKGSNPKDKIEALCKLLDKNKIEYGKASNNKNMRGFHFQSGKETHCSVSEGDLLISAHQPMSVLVQVLFEPNTSIEDSLTYDITAWSLPYAYGLEAYAVKDKMEAKGGYSFTAPNNNFTSVANPYGFVIPWQSVKSAKFLGALMQAGIKVRNATKAFTIEGQSYSIGTLIATSADNRKSGTAFFETVKNLAKAHKQEVRAVSTGGVSAGSDFGSRNVSLLEKPKILMLTDDGTSSGSAGATWYYFEQVLEYPITRVRAGSLGSVDLGDYNVLVMPEGSYYNVSKNDFDKVNDWVRGGGKLIALGRAVSTLVSKAGLSLKRSESEKSKKKDETTMDYDDQERDYISNSIPGAIFKVNMDDTHPLGYGLGRNYFSIKTGTSAYQKSDSAWDVGYLDENPFSVGFVGSNVKSKLKNNTIFGVAKKGRGEIVFLVDNPLFRGFWYEGLFLFSNAVFMVGN